MNTEFFNNLLGIKESFEMPARLHEIVTGPDASEFYDRLLASGVDLSHDVLRDYFQAEHGDRDRLKQDYTPDCVCDLIDRITDEADTLDICAGTGALTIATDWQTEHRCEEVSERAIPVLLLNMAIRNMRGTVAKKDVLRGKIEAEYVLTPGEKYSTIEQRDPDPERKWPRIISNPPYSLKFDEVQNYAGDPRYIYGLTPPKFSDLLFVQDAISRLEDGGTIVEVLPHGVLFRGAREENIRRMLVDTGWIYAVIGLPDGMFAATGIPVLLMVLHQHDPEEGILFIDAQNLFEKTGKVNVMTEEHIRRVAAAYDLRGEIKKLSHVADMGEIRENEYNLNIPRYVDTYEPEPVPDVVQIMKELAEIDRKIAQTEKELFTQTEELYGTTEEAQDVLNIVRSEYRQLVEEKYGSDIKDGEAEGGRDD